MTDLLEQAIAEVERLTMENRELREMLQAYKDLLVASLELERAKPQLPSYDHR